MENYEQLFYNTLLTSLSGKIPDDNIMIVMQQVSVLLDKYAVSEKTREIVPYVDIPETLKIYLVTRKIEGIAQSTLNLYSNTLQGFFRRINKPLDQITANDIRLYFYYYQKERGCGDRTLDTIRAILCTFFKWAYSNGYIEKDPGATIGKIKWSAKERESLTELELESVRNICTKPRDKAMIEFFYSTGCRVSELVNVKIKDINFTTKEVTLFGKGSKYRKSYINPRCEIALTEYIKNRKGDDEHLFTSLIKPYGHLTRRNVEKIISTLGEEAELNRPLFPHLIRHTTATIALQRGMDVTEIQKMLGHENVETTMIYAKTLDDNVKVGHKKCIV